MPHLNRKCFKIVLNWLKIKLKNCLMLNIRFEYLIIYNFYFKLLFIILCKQLNPRLKIVFKLYSRR